MPRTIHKPPTRHMRGWWLFKKTNARRALNTPGRHKHGSQDAKRIKRWLTGVIRRYNQFTPDDAEDIAMAQELEAEESDQG